MRIEVVYDGDCVIIYHNDKRLGLISYEAFCLRVLSPRQFKRLEREPDKKVWEVRKIDLSQSLADPTWSACQLPFLAAYSLPQGF